MCRYIIALYNSFMCYVLHSSVPCAQISSISCTFSYVVSNKVYVRFSSPKISDLTHTHTQTQTYTSYADASRTFAHYIFRTFLIITYHHMHWIILYTNTHTHTTREARERQELVPVFLFVVVSTFRLFCCCYCCPTVIVVFISKVTWQSLSKHLFKIK